MEKKPLTEEIIASIKEYVGDRPIYKKTLFGQDFVFTYLSREDYINIQDWIESSGGQKARLADIEQKILDYTLLWPTLAPEEWAMLPAGAIPTIAKHVQEKSYIDPQGGDFYDELEIEQLCDGPEGKTIPEEELEKIKKIAKYPMRLVKINGSDYIVRAMLRPEYARLQATSSESDGELEGVKMCLVWPKDVDWKNIPAGIPTILGAQVMYLSGFNDPSSVVEL